MEVSNRVATHPAQASPARRGSNRSSLRRDAQCRAQAQAAVGADVATNPTPLSRKQRADASSRVRQIRRADRVGQRSRRRGRQRLAARHARASAKIFAELPLHDRGPIPGSLVNHAYGSMGVACMVAMSSPTTHVLLGAVLPWTILSAVRGTCQAESVLSNWEVAQLAVGVGVEECAKHVFGTPATLAIATTEMAASYACGRFSDYLPVAFMHLAWSVVPLPFAIASHFLWNYFAATAGALLNTMWALKQNDDMPSVPAVCVEESGDVWKPVSKSASVTKPKSMTSCVPRVAVFRCGPCIWGATPVVFRSCVHSEYAAVCSRVCAGRAPWDGDIAANKKVWAEIERNHSKSFANELKKHTYAAPFDDVADFEGWVSRYSKTISKRLRELNVTIAGRNATSRELIVRAFIKVERLPAYLPEVAQKVKKPRLIQGRSDAVKLIQGPFFWRVGKWLAAAWNGTGDLYYPGGSSCEKLGAWAFDCEQEGLIPLPFDMEAYDSCVGPGPTRFWSGIMKRLDAPKNLQNFLKSRQSEQRGVTKSKVRYTRMGQVSSGDGDTTVGNTAIHGIGWRVVLKRLGVRARIMINGDDSVVAVMPSDVAKIMARAPQEWRRLGFNLTSDGVHNWNTVSFCSGQFWHAGRGRVFGPTPARVISKTFWTIHKFKRTKEIRFLRGVVGGLQASASHVPLLSVLLDRLDYLLGPGVSIVYGSRKEVFHTEKRLSVTKAAMDQLSEITGLPLQTLKEMETELVNLPTYNAVLRGHRWQFLAESPLLKLVPGSLFGAKSIECISPTQPWYTRLCCVVAEEAFKRALPYCFGTIVIVCIEMYQWWQLSSFREAARIYGPTLLLHFVWAWMSPINGFAAHMFWNEWLISVGTKFGSVVAGVQRHGDLLHPDDDRKLE